MFFFVVQKLVFQIWLTLTNLKNFPLCIFWLYLDIFFLPWRKHAFLKRKICCFFQRNWYLKRLISTFLLLQRLVFQICYLSRLDGYYDSWKFYIFFCLQSFFSENLTTWLHDNYFSTICLRNKLRERSKPHSWICWHIVFNVFSWFYFRTSCVISMWKIFLDQLTLKKKIT